MEKEQPDSLATVAVVSEKMSHSPHSNYAPSEVYSSAEPPPAYMRPKSTSVQIARIAAITLVTMSVVLGSFILAASWVQARASCTPESIALMQAELRLQQQEQQQQASSVSYQQSEFLKHLQPEALIQDNREMKEAQQTLIEQTPVKKDIEPDTKDTKVQKEDENNSKSDSESGDHDDDDDDDDYDDDDFPPVHIKLPLQFDFDEIAGTLIQEARSRVSCVVERRRADQVMDDANNNSIDNGTDSRYQRLSGERVAILCESGNPQQEQQDQEMMTPIIIPLGTVQVPLQSQEANPRYHQYQVNTQYQVPDMQQLPLSDPRGLNHIPPGILPPELRNIPQVTMEMRPPRIGQQTPMMGPQVPVMGPQVSGMGPQVEMRQIPIELRHFPVNSIRGMRPPMPQDPQQVSMMHQPIEQPSGGYGQEHGPLMMPPPASQLEAQIPNQRIISHMFIPQTEQRPPQMQPQVQPEMPQQSQPQPQPEPQIQVAERQRSPFQGIPLEIRRIIQQVPLEIKNIIQHITGEGRPVPVQVPEGARRENVQQIQPFSEGVQPIPLGLPLPVEVRNLLEHGNIEGRQRPDGSNEQQEAKPFPGPDDDSEEERNFPVPAEIRNIIHQVIEGNVFPVPRFGLPLRPVESLEIPVQARAEVSDDQSSEQDSEQHQQEQEQPQTTHMMIQQQQPQQSQQEMQQPQQHEQEDESRPHYVQPRSVRSIPEAFTHRREKRVRRCACDCAC